MDGLTDKAVAVRGDFNPQDIANTLWAFATLGLRPSESLLGDLTSQLVLLIDTFRPPEYSHDCVGIRDDGADAQRGFIGRADSAGAAG